MFKYELWSFSGHFLSCLRSILFTCVLLEYFCTYIAFYLAAPMKFAITTLTNDNIFSVVASTTAKYTAAI